MTAAPATIRAAAVDAPPPRESTPDAARTGSAFRKTVLSVAGQGVASGTSFVTAVVVGRTCGQGDFGAYALALTVVLLLRAVQSDLIGAPYSVYCGRRHGAARLAYTGSILVHQFVLSALAVVVLLGLIGALALGVGPAVPAATAWALLGAVPFLLLRDQVRQTALAHLRSGEGLVLDAGVAILQLGALAVLARLGLLTVAAVYAVMGAASGLVALGWFLARRQPMRFDLRRVGPDWRDNWAFSRWALAGQLVSRATGYLTPWVLAVVHGEAATGMLAACVTLANLAGTFISGVSAYLTPRAALAYADGGRPALLRVLRQTALLYLATVGVFCLAVVLSGDALTALVYGSRYAGTGPALALLAFGMLAASLGITAGNGLWALDRPGANFAADVATLLTSLATLALLVGPLGVTGAAAAVLVGSVVGAAVRGVTLRWLLRTGPQGGDA